VRRRARGHKPRCSRLRLLLLLLLLLLARSPSHRVLLLRLLLLSSLRLRVASITPRRFQIIPAPLADHAQPFAALPQRRRRLCGCSEPRGALVRVLSVARAHHENRRLVLLVAAVALRHCCNGRCCFCRSILLLIASFGPPAVAVQNKIFTLIIIPTRLRLNKVGRPKYVHSTLGV
jgi:hypothetical protein